MNKRSISLCLAVATVACSPKLGHEFRGYWLFGADGPAFQPCGSSDKWWVTIDSTWLASATVETSMVFEAPGAPPPRYPPPLFTVLRGDTSSLGAYGPGGAYRRHLFVRRMA